MQTAPPFAPQGPTENDELTTRLPVLGKIILIYFWLSALTTFRSTYIDQNGLFENSPSYPYSAVQKFAIASDQLVAVYWWLAFAAVFLIKDRRIMVWRSPLFTSAVFVIATQLFALVVRFEDYSPIATPLVDVFGRVAICLAIAVSSIPPRFAESFEPEASE